MNQPLPGTHWKAEYPFESHWLDTDGLRYHYIDQGQGRPLLMVHGNPTWSFYWRRLISGLSGKYRAVAPDHIGCGLSDKPQTYDYSLSQHTGNLLRLVETLELKDITLVAHDWGGAIGLGAAVAQPDRFSRLVLLNTGAFPPPYIPWRIRVCRTPCLGRVAVQGLNLFARAAPRMAVYDRRLVDQMALAGLIAPYDSWANRVAIYRFVKDIPHSPAHPTWQTLETLEQSLSLLADRPVQLIWGMRDWCFRPECLERFERIFPRAESHRLENAGHWVMEEVPEDVMRIVQAFMDRTGGASEQTHSVSANPS